MKELKQYYRQIQSWLPCGGRLKRRMMASITANIEGYLAEHPHLDFAALQSHFGTPQQIAAAYVDDMDTSELLSAIHNRRKILLSVVYGVTAIVAIWAVIMLILLIVGLLNETGPTIVTGPYVVT